MTFLLNAAQCPAPTLRTALLSISAAGATNGTSTVAESIASPSSPTALTPILRRNATRQDLTGAFGGGCYFVALGLTLSAGNGLNVLIAPGTAMIDGPVNIETAAALAVPNGIANCFIFLLQNGTLAYSATTAPPPGACCLLGNVTTAGGAVTAVDYSGVLHGLGTLQRSTADAGMPTDAPPAGLHFLTQTQGGLYYWNGVAYISIADPPSSIVVSLAPDTQTFSAAGKNYLVTSNFSGSGVFSDAFYESLLTASNPAFTVSPNQNGQTTGAASWIVYVPSDQGSNLANITLTASVRGRGWSGASAANIAAAWTITQIV